MRELSEFESFHCIRETFLDLRARKRKRDDESGIKEEPISSQWLGQKVRKREESEKSANEQGRGRDRELLSVFCHHEVNFITYVLYMYRFERANRHR